MARIVENFKRALDDALEGAPPEELVATYEALMTFESSLKSRVNKARQVIAKRARRDHHKTLLREYLQIETDEYTVHVRDDRGYWATEGFCEYSSHFDDPYDITPFHLHIELRKDGVPVASLSVQQTFETDVDLNDKTYFSDIDTEQQFENHSLFSNTQIKALFCALCSGDEHEREFRVHLIENAK